MDFRVGRIRFPFRRFFRALISANDPEGRRRVKFDRLRNRLGIILGVGLAGLVAGSGLIWQKYQQNRTPNSAEMAWETDDLDAIDRDLNASLRTSRTPVAVSTPPDLADPLDEIASTEEIAPPPEMIVQMQSTATDEGPSLLLTHGSKRTAEEKVSRSHAETRHREPVGATLLGVIEEIPANEQPEFAVPRKNGRAARGSNAGPAIVPGQSTR
ncbi:MAG: hypothetical protein WEB58_08555 [Planctomycetaceae bacterium]